MLPTIEDPCNGDVFSTGLEKSKFAPPEVKARVGATRIFITPPKGSRAVPVVRPKPYLAGQNVSAVTHTLVTPAPGLKTLENGQPRSNFPATSPEEHGPMPPSVGVKLDKELQKPLPHLRGMSSAENVDHSWGSASAQKVEASSSSESARDTTTAVEVKENSEKDGAANLEAGSDIGINVDLAAANASFKSSLQGVADTVTKAADTKGHESKENMKPISPKMYGKQDFLAQMMVGLQDFRKKQGPTKHSKETPFSMPITSGVSLKYEASRDSLEAKSPVDVHETGWQVIRRPQLKGTKFPHAFPTTETCLTELNRSIVKVKEALKSTKSGSFVLNIENFAFGLAMPATGFGEEIQVRLSTAELHNSGEAELSIQIRCDDMKTLSLVFRGKCLLTNPATERVVTIKVSRTTGNTSFLTKRQTGHKEMKGTVIYGIEYMIPADDSGVKLRQDRAKPSTVECKSQSTLQFLQLWDAFRDPGTKKFAIRFPGHENEAAAMWARVETFLKKVDEQECDIEGHKWVKNVSPAGGKAFWKLIRIP